MKIQDLSYSALGLSCPHSRKVYNRYTREWLWTPCGKCNVCQQRKSSNYISQLKELELRSKSVYLVTLTYNDAHLPLYHIDEKGYHAFREERESYDMDSTWYSVLSDKASMALLTKGAYTCDHRRYGAGNFGLLQKKDVQLFLKRFRIYVERKTNYTQEGRHPLSENFKYFAIGEYGSQTFRPHYHLELFFNKPIDGSELEMACRSAWSYGNIDVQVVESSASSYCAGYLNAHGAIPCFLCNDNCRPFVLHSKARKGIPFTMYKSQAVEFLKNSFEETAIPLVFPRRTQDGVVLSPIAKSTRIHFFPRLRNADNFTVSEMAEIYHTYARDYEKHQVKPQGDRQRLLCKRPLKEDQKVVHRFSGMKVWRLDKGTGTAEFLYYDHTPYYCTLAEALKMTDGNVLQDKIWEKCPWDPTEKIAYSLSSDEVYNLYISKKVYENYKLYAHCVESDCNHFSFSDYCLLCVAYNHGISCDECIKRNAKIFQRIRDKRTAMYDNSECNSSFELSLLAGFYSTLEAVVENPSELRYWYQYHIDRYEMDIRKSDMYFDIFEEDSPELQRLTETISCMANTVAPSVKHKERNSYLQLRAVYSEL